MADDAASGQIEVAYGKPDMQVVVALPFSAGMTAGEAVARSGLLERFTEIDRDALVLGIYGERVDALQNLRNGDRVEICRPLSRDPREMRREALAAGVVVGKAGK